MLAHENQWIIPTNSKLIALTSERKPHCLKSVYIANNGQLAFDNGKCVPFTWHYAHRPNRGSISDKSHCQAFTAMITNDETSPERKINWQQIEFFILVCHSSFSVTVIIHRNDAYTQNNQLRKFLAVIKICVRPSIFLWSWNVFNISLSNSFQFQTREKFHFWSFKGFRNRSNDLPRLCNSVYNLMQSGFVIFVIVIFICRCVHQFDLVTSSLMRLWEHQQNVNKMTSVMEKKPTEWWWTWISPSPFDRPACSVLFAATLYVTKWALGLRHAVYFRQNDTAPMFFATTSCGDANETRRVLPVCIFCRCNLYI